MTKKEKMRKGTKENMKKIDRNNGITLIALVVTIVVLIILATVSVNAVFGQNGIIKKAKQAKEMYEESVTNEDTAMQELLNEMASYETKKDDTTGVTVTVGGQTVTLTKGNVANYLGKVVTNYVPTTSSVTIGSTSYTVSTNYRLYYVDFDGKYGETNGVYLKADCTSNQVAFGQDTTADTASNVKIRALNPSLYESGVTAPTASNENMKVVTWLTNTSNWDSLKTGSSLASKVNYVVGAPSVEMMMDSYNTKYNLTESTPNTGTLSADTARVKLFYQYPTTVDSDNDGYEVGPGTSDSAKNGYDYYTSSYSVKTDSTIDSMYYPGDNQWYWLASPSAYNTDSVLYVYSYGGGMVFYGNSYNANALCPLVSLQSSAILELQ